MSIGYAYVDLSNLTEQGCEDATGIWRCHIDTQINNASGKFVGDIGCFSTSSNSVDKGCFGALELQNTAYMKDCTYSVTEDREFVYHPCEMVSFNKGYVLPVLIDPGQVDLSNCDKFQEEGIYVNQCPADGKEVVFSGLINLADNESNIAIVTEMRWAGIDWFSLIINNIVYIVLVAVIIVIAYWVFAPHKPMFKERTATERAEKPVTRREKKYGRKL